MKYFPKNIRICVSNMDTSMFSTVNLKQLIQGLEELGKKYKLLNADVTCFDVLHAKTGSLILVACHERIWPGEVACLLIELWFPGLYEAQLKSGRDWERFWSIDIKVEVILSEAGYPNEDEASEEELEEEEPAEEAED